MVKEEDERKRKIDPGYILALTPEEFAKLRRLLDRQDRLDVMLTSHERVVWFWGTVGVWIKWIGAIGAGLIAAKLLLGDFKELLRGWLGK